MRSIRTFKAEHHSWLEEVEPLQLRFMNPIPPLDLSQADYMKHYQDVYAAEAKTLVDAIMKHAPGGLVDALFAELAHRKASILSVAHEE